MTDVVIETDALTKYFGKRCVVNSLSLRIPKGSVFGFLGRNGAGKSTTIRMLMGMVSPTRGGATVLGVDCTRLTPEIRARVGYLAEGHHAYGWMSVAEAEKFQRGTYQSWNEKLFQTVIDHFRLTRSMKAKDLSRGQRAGLCLALTLAPEPELLVLDDPALGLDPVARHSLLQAMIYVTRQAGRTILFSSHLLSDVERVADRIAVIDAGVLRADCPVEVFRERIRRLKVTFPGPAPALTPIPGLLNDQVDGSVITMTIANYDESSEALVSSLGAPVKSERIDLSLEDAFIEYVSREGAHSLLDDAAPAKPEALQS